MNFNELVEATAKATEQPKKNVKSVLEAAIFATTQALKLGDDVTLAQLGKFSVKSKPARTARNPRTGEAVQVPEHRVVDFKINAQLKQTIA